MPRALYVHDRSVRAAAEAGPLRVADLPEGDVLVRVAYSSLNYKDALAVTGRGKVIRGAFPFVPGIDLAGTVEASEHDTYAPGDRVVLTGWGTGEARWGGYATHARARAEHLVPLPDGLTLFDAMALGTAGFTAALAVMALERAGLQSGPVAVTGATGGVGSLAVVLLARAGVRVAASTGKADAEGWLRELGASEVIGRSVLGNGAARPLETARWGGAVDTVGGPALAALLASMQPHAAVAACGNAASADLATTVLPFILRGVSLLGIDSNTCPDALRRAAWARLAADIPRGVLRALTTTIPLGDVPAWAETILAGGVRGRVVVDVNSETDRAANAAEERAGGVAGDDVRAADAGSDDVADALPNAA